MEIIANFDGSFRSHGDGTKSIGTGYTIRGAGITFNGNEKYNLGDSEYAEFAESIALINLLEKLQELKLRGYDILIQGDCKYLIAGINNGKQMQKIQVQIEYIEFLLQDLRDHNRVRLEWKRREENRECDKLSKTKDTFVYNFNNKKNKTVEIKINAYNEYDAKNKFQRAIHNMTQNNLKHSRVSTKKKSINQMIREFKIRGIAHA